MKNLGNILKQAQKIQERVSQIQQELVTRTVESSSGGGMVTVTVNGRQEVVSIRIDPSVINPEDLDMLQDLVLAAVNSAIKKSQEMITEEMGKVTSGLNINIPGLF